MLHGLWNRVHSIFKKADTTEDILDSLILADVGPELSNDLVRGCKGDISALKDALLDIISIPSRPLPDKKPIIVLVIGSNGTGKTTTVAKLAHYYRDRNLDIIIASADTYRDAANEQLLTWARRVGVEIVSSQKGQDAGAVIYDAYNSARAKDKDLLLVDTAGRLHTRGDLMEELRKISRVIKKLKGDGADKTYLILDATTGQNGIIQAERFMEAIGIDAVIIAKMDGTAKGGIAIAIADRLKIPIEFIGVGEGIEDLLPFDPVRFIEAIFTS
ncbi:MAG TPA: signal recognition particle-docking protein FtsY [bacterium (Candidatus Stahlbacteria)]|nr:signal recognition particle-docking protein FtsY [Candidatus Stahlbacteria bacterium]